MVLRSGAGLGCSMMRSLQFSAMLILPTIPTAEAKVAMVKNSRGAGNRIYPLLFSSMMGMNIAKIALEPMLPM